MLMGVFVILVTCLAVTMALSAQNTALQDVTESTNQFSSALFREVAGRNPSNLITSPLSAFIALSMAGYGSRGDTEKEFKQVLHHPEESIGRTGYVNLIDNINAIENVELRLANKIFINENFSVKSTFHELTQTAFRSASQNVNFTNALSASTIINKWVEEKTNNRIKDLLTPAKVHGGIAMILVNAVYFKGQWTKKFEIKLTEDKPFYVTKDQVKNVSIMHKFEDYRYGVLPELKARFVELLYKGEELSMIIILPDEVDGLAEVEQKLAQQNLTELVKTGNKTKVSLFLPKFKIESTIDLGAVLRNMGLKKAFDANNADFSGISNSGVFISSVVQKAFIEVNEEGSEAAAATRIMILKRRRILPKSEPVVFNVDHPFHLSIIKSDESSNTKLELFSAHVVDPSQ